MVAKSRDAETRCRGSILVTTTFQWWNSPTSSHSFYLFSHSFYIISFLPSAIATAVLLMPDARGLWEPVGPTSLRAVGPRHPWLSSPHVLKDVCAEQVSRSLWVESWWQENDNSTSTVDSPLGTVWFQSPGISKNIQGRMHGSILNYT